MFFLSILQSGKASFFKKVSSFFIRNRVAFYDDLAKIAWHDNELFKNEHLLGYCNRVLDSKTAKSFSTGINDCSKRAVIPCLQEKWIYQAGYSMGLPRVRLVRCVDDSIPVMGVTKMGDETVLLLSKDIEKAFFLSGSSSVGTASKKFTLAQAQAITIHELTHASENHAAQLAILKIFSLKPEFLVAFSKQVLIPVDVRFVHREYLDDPFFYAAYGRFLETRADQGVFNTKDTRLIKAYKRSLEQFVDDETEAERELKDYDKHNGTDKYYLDLLCRSHPPIKKRIKACTLALAALSNKKKDSYKDL